MHSLLILKFILASVCFLCASSAPFEITKCKASDSKCLKSVTQMLLPKVVAGVPEYNIEPLDPVLLDKIDASTPNLKLILTELQVKGLKDCTAKKIERNVEKSQLSVTLLCTVTAEGHYEMNGRLLVLPLEGNDKFKVNLNKAIFKVEASLSDITKDGKKYWNIKSWDHAYKLQEKSTVHFDNLFNGNKDLAKAAQEVIEGNGNEIIDEVGSPVIKAIITKIVDAVQKWFHAIPLEDLVLD